MKKLAGGVVVLVSVLAVAWLMSRPAPESKPAPDLADDSLDGLLERINRVMPELRIVAREGNKVWLTAAEGKSIWICAGLIVGTAGINPNAASPGRQSHRICKGNIIEGVNTDVSAGCGNGNGIIHSPA